jgi:VIT1/CCC1 family predicted Fe2+/Mn2+ transporter
LVEVVDRIRHWRVLLRRERDAAALYERLAAADGGDRRVVLTRLAEAERRHAEYWESRLREAGAPGPAGPQVSVCTRILVRTARWWSVGAVLPLVERSARRRAGHYDAEPGAAAELMAAEERGHAHILAALVHGPGTDPRAAAATMRRGGLRRAALRVSNGLMSNAALILGVAGSGAARSVIRLVGVVGLLVGALLLGAGEYFSWSSQRSGYERGLAGHGSEHDDLVLTYRAKGLDQSEAQQFADRLIADRRTILSALAGSGPVAASPWAATLSSVAAFIAGGFIVLGPFLFSTGPVALATAVVLFAVALIVVGLTRSGRGPMGVMPAPEGLENRGTGAARGRLPTREGRHDSHT